MYAGALVPWYPGIVTRRHNHGHSKASPLEDERCHAAGALEAPGAHTGDLSEVSLPDARPSRLPHVRDLRGSRGHQDRGTGNEVIGNVPTWWCGGESVRIAVDAIGGGHAPDVVVAGAGTAGNDLGGAGGLGRSHTRAGKGRGAGRAV